METNVRMSRPEDINELTGLDLRCFDYPLDLEALKLLVNESGSDGKARLYVVTVLRHRVGFVVGKKLDDKVYEIVRLGILPKWRRNGLGRLLVQEVDADARRACCDVLRITVPEIHCQPKGQQDADDVSEFLNKLNFHTTGVKPDFAVMYGDSVDGIIWERKVL